SYKVGGKIDKAVEEVYDTIMTYNGKAIYCPYFAVSCGKTQASKEVWGGARAYLVSAESKYDYLADYYNLAAHSYTSSKIKSNFLATKVISEANVKSKIQSKLGVTPSGDPSTWFKFLSEAEGGYTSGGYINKIVVGGKTTTGKNVRSMFSLRSACFEVSYSGGNFTFTTKGYGHGVGMSQWGAHFYADKEGWDYKQILSHYYKGIAFAKVA
ncbi:MAG: SpoIID/LytB domain-containing protein, partial [Oscillospiraceae bacterium]|nr:SpoIID/LytB domain-containing protein [Oscillospiraceae bacterium]